MKQYLDLLQTIRDTGVDKDDRTGVGTRGIFGAQMRYDLSEWFPLVTTKKTYLRGIIVELIWLIRGETNIKYLVDRDVHIRDEWPFQNWLENHVHDALDMDDDDLAQREEQLEEHRQHHKRPVHEPEMDVCDLRLAHRKPKYAEERMALKKKFIDKIKSLPADHPFVLRRGDLGPVYGHQRRNFNSQGVDQLAIAIDQIRKNPTNRRIIVSAWNPVQLSEMLLPPCHMFYQFNVDTTSRKLHLQMYQRSADMFLGVPFNIASYSTLLMLIAKITGYEPGTFVHTLGDTHIYQNHRDAVNEQLGREPRPLPELNILKDIKTLEDIEALEREDFELVGYDPHPRISAPVAV